MSTPATAPPPWVEITLSEEVLRVPPGSTVAAALAHRGAGWTRLSVSGQRRAPLCGMGVCYECRVLVNGRERLACQTVCAPGMRVETTDMRTPTLPCP